MAPGTLQSSQPEAFECLVTELRSLRLDYSTSHQSAGFYLVFGFPSST